MPSARKSALRQAFVRLRRPSHFLSLAREKVTQERGTPLGAFRPSMGEKSVSRGRAFRRHIRVPAKRHRPPVDARFAACRPRLTAAQGTRQSREPSRLALGAQPPGGCKSKAKDNSVRLIWLFEECAQDARCSTRGPCAAVRHGRPARRGIGTMPIPFRRHMDVPSKSQPMPHALSGQEDRKAPSGVASLWVTFLWPSREK